MRAGSTWDTARDDAAGLPRDLRLRRRGGLHVWELLGFRRHVQLPPDGEPGYVGLRRDDGGELAVTHRQWAADRYGLSTGDGPRFEMYVYVDDLDATMVGLARTDVTVLREAEDMPWGERIATIADPEGNPVALCQTR